MNKTKWCPFSSSFFMTKIGLFFSTEINRAVFLQIQERPSYLRHRNRCISSSLAASRVFRRLRGSIDLVRCQEVFRLRGSIDLVRCQEKAWLILLPEFYCLRLPVIFFLDLLIIERCLAKNLISKLTDFVFMLIKDKGKWLLLLSLTFERFMIAILSALCWNLLLRCWKLTRIETWRHLISRGYIVADTGIDSSKFKSRKDVKIHQSLLMSSSEISLHYKKVRNIPAIFSTSPIDVDGLKVYAHIQPIRKYSLYCFEAVRLIWTRAHLYEPKKWKIS